MTAPKYPSYKPGHSKNIRLLPEHWAELPLKRLFRLEKREPLEGDEIVTAFRDGTVTLRKNRREDGFTNALKEIGYQRIHKGDLVVHAMDAFAGAIGVSDSDGKSSPVYSACTATKDAIPYFYAYYLRDLALHGFIESLAKGIRERSTDFRWSDASMVAVPVPPRIEQLAIARFLDRETAKIDALIAEQQRLIELLQEKRQAVISHAVTKGLNPNAAMKDSGVEWLGEVPEHWEMRKFGWDFQAGMGQTILREDLEQNGIPVYSATEDDTVFGYLTNPSVRLDAGDIVIPARGNCIGAVKLMTALASCTQTTIYCKMRTETFIPGYVFAYLRSHRMHLFPMTRTAIPQITVGEVLGNRIPCPPLQEQGRIAEEVSKSDSFVGGMIERSLEAIALLQERRSALISAAVTGQIDVRGLATEEEP